MGEIPVYVVDATVVGKWYLHDEILVEAALQLFDDFSGKRIGLVAPSHIWYEIASIIAKAVGAGRISTEQSFRAFDLFRRTNIPVVHSQLLIRRGLEYSANFQCSLYDATYLALADLMDISFLSADVRLSRTLRGRFVRALWIEDYPVLGGPNESAG